MHPEASRLVYRIKTALRGESLGLETASLAFQYTAAVIHANERIARCLELAKIAGNMPAFLETRSDPKLFDQIDTLEFAELEQWRKRCQIFRWTEPPALAHEQADALRQRFDQIEDRKEWLLNAFRVHARAREVLPAFAIATVLLELHPDDDSLKDEHARLKKALEADAQQSLDTTANKGTDDKELFALAAHYRSQGLDLDNVQGAARAALERERAATVAASAEQMKAVVARADSAREEDGWRAMEALYLACDYKLTIDETRAAVDSSLREAFAQVGNALSQQRALKEATVQLQRAVDRVKDLKKASRSRANAKRIKEGILRVQMLHTQFRRLGRRIAPDLQEEVRKLTETGNRRRIPLALASIAVLAGLVFASFWTADKIKSRAQLQEMEAEGLAAMQQARKVATLDEATSALKRWQPVIAETKVSDGLQEGVASLETWIAEQETLLATYDEQLQALERFRDQPRSILKSSDYGKVIETIETTRSQLAPSFGQDLDQRAQAFKKWRLSQLEETRADAAQQLARLIEQARHALEVAATDTGDDFERSAEAAQQALNYARQLIAENSDARSSTDLVKTVARLSEEMAELRSQHDSVLAGFRSLEQAESLENYYRTLDEISGYSKLARIQRSDIDRALRLRSQFASLKQALILPDNEAAWKALAAEGRFEDTHIELSEIERVFVARLADDPLFPGIYTSNVKYFEGSSIPKKQYSVFLVDPVEKGETTGLKTGINFSFKVRGFGENGRAEEQSREMNFLSHPDGSFWGFFYEPSEKCSESVYFEEQLHVALLQLMAKPRRFAVFQVIEDLLGRRTLAPSFKAYWLEQMLTLMEMDTWKWGLALSPSLQEFGHELKTLDQDGFEKRQWLSTLELTSPSRQLANLLRETGKIDLLNEVKTMAALYEYAIKGEFDLAGFVNEQGRAQFKEGVLPEQETLWVVGQETGRIEQMDTVLAASPFSPVVRYRLEGLGPRQALQKARSLSGISLQEEPYVSVLPELFGALQ